MISATRRSVAGAPPSSRRQSSHHNSYGGGTTGSSETETAAYVLKVKIDVMKEDLKNAQESFISRERAYRTRISELEEDFGRIKARKTGWMRSSAALRGLKDVHHRINESVELAQDRTAQIVAAQDKVLLHTYRGRLNEIRAELEREKGKTDDGSMGWIEKGHALEAEVEGYKETSDLLERLNQHLSGENKELKDRVRCAHDADQAGLRAALGHEKEKRIALQEDFAGIKKENIALQDQV